MIYKFPLNFYAIGKGLIHPFSMAFVIKSVFIKFFHRLSMGKSLQGIARLLA